MLIVCKITSDFLFDYFTQIRIYIYIYIYIYICIFEFNYLNFTFVLFQLCTITGDLLIVCFAGAIMKVLDRDGAEVADTLKGLPDKV